MLNYENTNIEKVSVHTVGNKTNGEAIHLSKSELNISDQKLRELLIKFFLYPLKNKEYYSFTSAEDDFTQNPMFNFASHIFDNEKAFHQNSINIASHLYDLAEHPQIKSGDVFVVYFTGLIVDDEMVNALGIFKSENRHPFLKLDNSTDEFSMMYEDGINIEKLDKGCLIMDTERSIGFRVCAIDNTNKSSEAQYWNEKFLQLKPFNDDFYFTKQYMNITKEYVVNELPEEMDRVDKIDLLNRSSEYFKTHDNFSKKEFEADVLQEERLINSFQGYNKRYMQEYDIDLADEFEISPQAVKSQNRIFKSVLKLDRNFHIYIHGDTGMIRKGVENDGRKYYKIYFENEA
ncbi:MAG: nucleoid-associated protein [Ignavibacteriaceae bacterium]